MSTNYTFTTIAAAKKVTGFGYLGSVNSSSKLAKNIKMNVQTYVLYLAPFNLSGYQVCPKATDECRASCLFTSGRVLLDKKNTIVNSRIAKTKLFFEQREFFNRWLFAEIAAAKVKAEKEGHLFSVRLNGTSDISPLLFTVDGKNIFETFSDVQFYDYTKVANRFRLAAKYPNYDLTFSYSGENWKECETALNSGVRVAAVFEKQLPATYKGFAVVNGDETDLRYFDASNVIVGLKYKRTRNKIDFSTSKFVISLQQLQLA